MRTNHVDNLIGAYLDNQLSLELRQEVELHVKECPRCAHYLLDTRRLDRELGPLMKTVLGQPTPSSALRSRVREKLYKDAERPFYLFWMASTRVLNTAGTIAVVLLLGFGLFAIVRGQLQQPVQISTTSSLNLESEDSAIQQATAAPLPSPIPPPTSLPQINRSQLSDTLPASLPSLPPAPPSKDIEQSVATTLPSVPQKEVGVIPPPFKIEEEQPEPDDTQVQIPTGTIAFALFDSTPGLEIYEVHLINPDGSQHRILPLKGVSEPALHPDKNDYPLALRGWGGPAISRQLLSSDAAGDAPQPVSHFWEDAQPDWSPLENRLIFASQRESDRHWRLYTAWGDGSLEVNLRREGRSPTMAPDGYRFAFESCDNTGNRCGLWLSDLVNSEHEARPFLIDTQAKSPDWSPVSEEIVYMSKTKDSWDIYLIESDGRNMRRLTNDPANEGLPVWSPDGQWIAFVSDRGGNWGLWMLHVTSGQFHSIVTFEDHQFLTPPSRLPPYNQHGSREWWDEQLSWGP